MQEMKIHCTSRAHADKAVAAARRMGYRIYDDYNEAALTCLALHAAGFGAFGCAEVVDYPEYALYGDHLLPVSEGWVENEGGCPALIGTKIDVLYRDGRIERNIPALRGAENGGRKALRWWRIGSYDDIIAYRLAEPETPCRERGLTEERDGRFKLPVGARVVILGHATTTSGDDEACGVIVSPPDADGDYVIKDDDGRYWLGSAEALRPIRSERDEAVAELRLIAGDPDLSVIEQAEKIYDLGYRKQENNNG